MPTRAADAILTRDYMAFATYSRPVDFPLPKLTSMRFDYANITADIIRHDYITYQMIYGSNTLMKWFIMQEGHTTLGQWMINKQHSKFTALRVTYPEGMNGIMRLRDDGTILITGSPMIIMFREPNINVHVEDRSRLSIVIRFRDNNITYDDRSGAVRRLKNMSWFHNGNNFKTWVRNRDVLQDYWETITQIISCDKTFGKLFRIYKWLTNGEGHIELLYEK